MHEDALLEERLYALANLLAAEEHIVEMIVKNNNADITKTLIVELGEIRTGRRALLDIIFTEQKHENGDVKTNLGAFWCSLKHMILSKYHLEESIMKSVNLINIEKTADIILILNKQIIHTSKNFIELQNCLRCEEDL